MTYYAYIAYMSYNAYMTYYSYIAYMSYYAYIAYMSYYAYIAYMTYNAYIAYMSYSAYIACMSYCAYITCMTYYAYMTFSVDSTTRVSAVSQLPDAEDSGTPSASAKKLRRKINSDGLLLTHSGSVSMASNEVNVKFDSSYSSSENTVTLLGRRLTL